MSVLPSLRRGVLAAVSLLLVIAAATVAAAESDAARAPHVTARLVTEHDAIAPGQPFVAALVLRPDRGWHSYWQVPGDTGLPTRIEWRLPEGAKAGPIQWPAPERIAFGELTNYGYHGEVVLPMTIVPGPGLVPGDAFELAGRARWLVCDDVCIPGSAELALALPVSDRVRPADGPWPRRRAAALETAPQPLDAKRAVFEIRDGTLVAELAGALPETLAHGRLAFFPLTPEAVDHGDAPVVSREDAARIVVQVARAPDAPALERLAGILVHDDNGVVRQYRFDAVPAAAPVAPPDDRSARPESVGAGRPTLALVWLLGFAGGLVLNLMPCVFPVLSLKVLKLIDSGRHDARGRRRSGLAYTAGTVATFLVVAAAMLALRGAGREIGWGFQLQSPAFVGAMAYLMLFLGLALSGLVELGAGLTRVGNVATDESRLTGSFLTGVLATVVATPCTAPFMGSAMGYAVTQPPAIALSVFVALGLGLASPFLAIAFVPALAAWLPRPGRWMETLKQFLAFPLYLTAAWLAWVLARQAGTDAVGALMVGAVLIGFATWVARLGATGSRRPLPLALALLSVVGALWLLPGIGGPQIGNVPSRRPVSDTAYPVVPFSESRLEAALADGRTVFVNLTADWCITCKVNERVAIDRPSVSAAFAERDVVYLKGDWTEADPAITRVLERFGRTGVPLYLVYRDGAARPVVLPQLLTPEVLRDAVGAG